MGPNMSKYIPYINMNKNSPKQAFKIEGYTIACKLFKIKNFSQDSTHAK